MLRVFTKNFLFIFVDKYQFIILIAINKGGPLIPHVRALIRQSWIFYLFNLVNLT